MAPRIETRVVDHQLVVDPIDGTRSTFRGLPTDLNEAIAETTDLAHRFAGRRPTVQEARYLAALSQQVKALTIRSRNEQQSKVTEYVSAGIATNLGELVSRTESKTPFLDAEEARQAPLEVARAAEKFYAKRTRLPNTPEEIRSAARRVIDESRYLSTGQGEWLDARIDGDDGVAVASRVATFGTSVWRSTFFKGMSSDRPIFTAAEEAALGLARSYGEQRGLDLATSYGTPIDVDPLIHEASAERPTLAGLSTNVETDAPVYKGVVAAAPVFTWDGEAVDPAGDSTPTFTQPVVNAYKVESYIGASIELSDDSPQFSENFGAAFNRGFGDALQKSIIVGTGPANSQPTGLFSVSSGIGTVSVGSAGHISAVDVRAAWDSLPEVFRSDPSCVWIMHPDVLSQIRADAGAASQVDVVVDRAGTSIMGSRVISSSHCPDWTGTSGTAQYLCVGAMSQFTIATRMGLYLERVSTVRATASGRPTGQRGWWSVARLGGVPSVPGAFTILTN